jgi:hypothetical protein
MEPDRIKARLSCRSDCSDSPPPNLRFRRLGCAYEGAAAFRPRWHKSNGTISAQSYAVNWKMGKSARQ